MRGIFTRNEDGFSAAELLITLFIASLFLITGFQLYSYVVRDGEESAQLSKASNLAYQYLRSTAANTTYVKSPCSTSSQPGSQNLATSTGLNNASVDVVVSCPYSSAPLNSASLFTATVTYSSPSGQETVTHAMLVKGVSTSGSITLNYTGSIQNWTVPQGVTSITILAKGAQGGSGTTYTGGLGASMQGTFTVTPGDVLKVLVGQEGGSNTSYKAGGGGGGSFVTTSSNSPLIVAGGGGGGGGNTNPSNGSPGLTTTSGGSSPSYTGGSSGGGGGGGSGTSGGGGLTGNGTNSGSSGPGMSFTNGGAGGAGGTCAAGGGAGGFGGGSGGEWCSQGATGAGGGYSGGAGVSSTGVAGGGGSYNSGTNQTNTSGVQSGNGQVKISW